MIFTAIIYFPVPYYIHSTGGLINISDKVIIKDEYKSSGSFNFAYVTEMQGKVLTYLFSFVMKDWDLVKKEDVQLSNESKEEMDYRNHMFLIEANQNATLVAYNAANKYYLFHRYHLT
jgi:PDZ domain-containing secreted protein